MGQALVLSCYNQEETAFLLLSSIPHQSSAPVVISPALSRLRLKFIVELPSSTLRDGVHWSEYDQDREITTEMDTSTQVWVLYRQIGVIVLEFKVSTQQRCLEAGNGKFMRMLPDTWEAGDNVVQRIKSKREGPITASFYAVHW